MSATRLSIRATLAIAAAAVVLSAAQFAGIDMLAAPHGAVSATAAAPQLQRVVVTASRTQGLQQAESAAAQQLPRVVVTASRRDFARVERLPTVVVTGQVERTATVAQNDARPASI